VWTSVELPVAARPIAVGAALAFAVAAGEFGATAFLARPDTATLPVAVFRLLSRPGGGNYGAAMAGCVLLAALTGLVWALADRLRAPSRTDWAPDL
jgi:thiamine transport system permease protein